MEFILIIVGIGIIIFSLVTAFMAGQFMVSIGFVLSGSVTALLFFGLSKVLSNQERITQLLSSNQGKLNYIKANEVKCSKCGKLYGDDRSSCPYCGNR